MEDLLCLLTEARLPCSSLQELVVGCLTDPKKAWLRIKQRATIYLWSLEPQYTDWIETVKTTLPPNHDNGMLFKAVQKEALKRKVELPNGLMDIRLHDIRRTFGSYQAISGASLQIIGKSLGHKSQQSTQVYARLHNDPVRASIDKATDTMLAFKTREEQ